MSDGFSWMTEDGRCKVCDADLGGRTHNGKCPFCGAYRVEEDEG